MTSSKAFIESRREMEKGLTEERVGSLGLSLHGLPYVVPLNYGYAAGKILFHCALTGKKLDYIRANPQVCFTVGRQFGEVVPHPQGAVCHVNGDSVICYGIARIISDAEERRKTPNTFNHCLQPDAKEITLEDGSICCAVEITVTEMTGREERDGKCVYWRQGFEEGLRSWHASEAQI
ncbi:MAG: pyridoxamine 5'-phosphate oxidase family protein [Chloroflexi bacterium]|nr:pyridoxamine 5'-phosphate oxidase family protein [Chloroflexota bacterium]